MQVRFKAGKLTVTRLTVPVPDKINTDTIGQSKHLQWSIMTCLSLNLPSQPITKTIN